MTDTPFETKRVPRDYDYRAPDGSEIRELLKIDRANMAHCTLSAETVSTAHRHRTVDELWYVLSGEGEVWRKQDSFEEVIELSADVSLSIPSGTHFQFRTTGSEPLRILIVTMPPWPGADEAVEVASHWNPDAAGESDSL
jgi:mannose-6-phosphate isomerase-like protein (cupin superfamily)